jgi:hypothetical protein
MCMQGLCVDACAVAAETTERIPPNFGQSLSVALVTCIGYPPRQTNLQNPISTQEKLRWPHSSDALLQKSRSAGMCVQQHLH